MNRYERDIICLTRHPWDGPRFRKQRFMSYLSERGHRVLYLEPSRSLVRRGGEEALSARPRLLGYRLRAVTDRVRVLTPSVLFPKPGSLPGTWGSHFKMTLEARAAGRHLGLEHPVVWVYDPHFAPFLGLLRPDAVVFDLVDDFAGYPYSRLAQRATEAHIHRLCDRADRVLLTSDVLADIYTPAAPYRVIPNGFDQALFRGSGEVEPRRSAGRLRAGFVGTLFTFVDFELLAATARRLPEMDFVLAGRIYSDEPSLGRLLDLPNVHYEGVVAPERVPGLIRTFDVCLCPFKVDRVSRAVSPLKVYEYLALRRPVVATMMEGLQRDPLGRFVDFVATAEEFKTLVQKRATHGRRFGSDLDAVLSDATWDKRCRAMAEFVAGTLNGAPETCE